MGPCNSSGPYSVWKASPLGTGPMPTSMRYHLRVHKHAFYVFVECMYFLCANICTEALHVCDVNRYAMPSMALQVDSPLWAQARSRLVDRLAEPNHRSAALWAERFLTMGPFSHRLMVQTLHGFKSHEAPNLRWFRVVGTRRISIIHKRSGVRSLGFGSETHEVK